MATRSKTASESPGRIPDSEMGRLLELIAGADSVELKMTVQDAQRRATIATLPLDPVEAQPRQVFFFDTPNLDLDKHGVVVRARRIQGGRADTVIKLRPVVPSDLPADLRRNPGFNVEVDALPGGFVCSGTLKAKLTGQEVREAVAGRIPIRKIFTRDQRALFRAHAPAGIELDDLVVLGPTFVLKAVFTPKATGRPLVGEMWLYPDGARLLELSTKCLPSEAFQVAAVARAYLASKGISLSGAQQTKTRTALDFFAAERRQEMAAAAAATAKAQEPAAPAKPARTRRATAPAARKTGATKATSAATPTAPAAAAAKPATRRRPAAAPAPAPEAKPTVRRRATRATPKDGG